MSKQLNEQKHEAVENFEKEPPFQQLSSEAQSTYRHLDSTSKHIVARHLEQDLRRIETEDWRGENGKQRERDRILEKVLPDLKSLLDVQDASDYWKRRLLEGKTPEEARLATPPRS